MTAPTITVETPIEDVRAVVAARRSDLSQPQLVLASELALRADDNDLAVDAMEAAVEQSPSEAALHQRLGVCRLKAGRRDEAVTSLNKALAFDPANVAVYQSLVSMAVADGDVATALFYARAQARACGSTPELVMQTVELLMRDERVGDALSLVSRFNESSDATAHSLRLEAELANRRAMTDVAIAAARRLCDDDPTDAERVFFLAQLLCNDGQFEAAADLLAETARRGTNDSRLFRILSSARTQTGDYAAALAAAISSVQLAPERSEFWYNAAMLAHTLGYTKQASDLAAKAAELDPDNVHLWMAYARLLQALHKVDEAVAALDRALDLEPDDAAIKDFRIYVLAARADAPSGSDNDEIRALPRSRDRGAAVGPGEWARTLRAMRVQWRVVAGLTARAVGHRAVKSRFGFLSALFEPLVQVLAVGVVLSLFNNSRPPIGNYFFFFYATGLMPLYLFVHICNHTLDIFRGQQTLLQVPIIKRLDLVLAEAFAELIICGSTTLLTFGAFQWLGLAPSTDNQMEAVEAYLVLFALAFGFGLMGAVINNAFPVYTKVWSVLQRFLYFASGVIILAEHMPLWVRNYAVWNPLLLLITWFRVGFFPQYQPPWLDKGYVILFAFTCVAIGLVLERASRRHMKLI